jgi:large subunit ribosomal protein L10
MPTEAKQAAVAELKEALSASNATIVADYRGLTVSDIQAVRRALRNDGITYRVVKNRLAKIAATQAGREELNDLLDGPTGLAMGAGDEVTLARVFLDAIRPYKTIVVRGGVVGAARIDADSITRLSLLPSREVLLAQLAGGMASPLSTMASLFAAPLRNLGYALSQLADKKEQEAPATVATAAAETPTEDAAAPDAEATAEAPEAPAEAPEAEVAAEAAPAGEAPADEASADGSAEADASPEPAESAADDNQSESESA